MTWRLLIWLAQGTGIGLITLTMLELVVAGSFRQPGLSPVPRALLRYLYIHVDRDMIQVNPACARYDPQVTYTLRPGRCVFANREFSTRYEINSLGLRDDEASLASPETVMLGDSVTMGWGVDQQEAYPEVFERSTGSRTLNAGVSSYGTVRELRTFERVKKPSVRNVVLHHMDNDYRENHQLAETGALKILSEEEYGRTIVEYARSHRYYPGQYALNLLAQLRAALRPGGSPALASGEGVSADVQADAFIKVLERAGVSLGDYRTVVWSWDADFVGAVGRRQRQSPVGWIQQLEVLDLSPLHREDGAFYTLDDHPTARGHQLIAAELIRWSRAGH